MKQNKYYDKMSETLTLATEFGGGAKKLCNQDK